MWESARVCGGVRGGEGGGVVEGSGGRGFTGLGACLLQGAPEVVDTLNVE